MLPAAFRTQTAALPVTGPNQPGQLRLNSISPTAFVTMLIHPRLIHVLVISTLADEERGNCSDEKQDGTWHEG
jgi:hypothetical protein